LPTAVAAGLEDAARAGGTPAAAAARWRSPAAVGADADDGGAAAAEPFSALYAAMVMRDPAAGQASNAASTEAIQALSSAAANAVLETDAALAVAALLVTSAAVRYAAPACAAWQLWAEPWSTRLPPASQDATAVRAAATRWLETADPASKTFVQDVVFAVSVLLARAALASDGLLPLGAAAQHRDMAIAVRKR